MTENYLQYLDWVVYQIYPKSFYDTNGDGIGDLRGIKEKLDYIQSLGVNAIWICPIYQSPQKDNGYDISDYYKVQPAYGDMNDFDELLAAAHGKGIKVIMDLVANHTSDQHFWFQEARKSRDNPYHDYYYWTENPPKGWKSVFGGKAWEYNPQTREYYLHSFAVEQPDVNWTNPKVRREFCKIVDFWSEKGVDGFRCDVLDFISKDFETGKMYDGPHLHEYIRELFGREGVKKLFTVGECQADEKGIGDLCGEGRGELKTAFQFEHFSVGRESRFIKKPHTVYEFTAILAKWQTFAQSRGLLYTLLTDNHDQPWLNSRLGNDGDKRYESATMLATAVYCLKGIPFIYQGQEIGAANSTFDTLADFDDVETLNYHQENANEQEKSALMSKINFGSRDNSRRPFAWSGEQNYGFTTGEKPWLPYATRSAEINLEREENAEKSVVRYYRALFALRNKLDVLRRGEFKEIRHNDRCFVYERAQNRERLLIVCNFEKETLISGLDEGKLLLDNLQTDAPVNRVYAPYEAAIYQL